MAAAPETVGTSEGDMGWEVVVVVGGRAGGSAAVVAAVEVAAAVVQETVAGVAAETAEVAMVAVMAAAAAVAAVADMADAAAAAAELVVGLEEAWAVVVDKEEELVGEKGAARGAAEVQLEVEAMEEEKDAAMMEDLEVMLAEKGAMVAVDTAADLVVLLVGVQEEAKAALLGTEGM